MEMFWGASQLRAPDIGIAIRVSVKRAYASVGTVSISFCTIYTFLVALGVSVDVLFVFHSIYAIVVLGDGDVTSLNLYCN